MTRQSIAIFGRPSWSVSRVVAVGVGAVAMVAIASLAAWLWRAPSSRPADDLGGAAAPPSTEVDGELRLSSAKLAAADLHASPVQTHTLQEVRRVPGTIGYNTARRLEVKMPAGGVVKQVVAKIGQEVKHGDTLAILTSIEVGMARDELVNAEADAALAKKESDWATEIATHLDALLKELDKRPEVNDVEEKFKGQVLGVHRDKVLSAYSKLVLADRTAESTEAVAQDGVISGIIVRERRSAREVAAAAFQSISEQSRFEAHQTRSRAQAALEHAERLVAVQQQKLAVLLGPYAEISSAPGDRAICELLLRAPLDGFVEDRLVADGAHFVASQTLFVIANTDTLFVSAQIYEREWASLNEANITDVIVESPSVPDRKVAAKMLYVSVGLSHATHAVPLVAELPNPDGRYKPGMFAWVSLPMGAPFTALAVPSAAVTRHEQRPFVFVEERPGEYRKVDVEVGRETPDYVEIVHGLHAGQKVVDRGAFVLKSELLLEGEEP